MKTEIYISHAWEPQSDEVLYPLVERLSQEKFNIVYDHKDLGYGGSISKFMDDLAESEAIILIVSNKYLKSEYCMYELLKIYEQKGIQNRIYPIVLPEVSIAKSTDRLNLVKYWEKESKELMQKIKELDDITFLEGITDDLNLYKSIRNRIAKLTHILKDINTLQVQVHKESNFEELVTALKANRYHKRNTAIYIPQFERSVLKKGLKPAAVVIPVVILVVAGIFYFGFRENEDIPEPANMETMTLRSSEFSTNPTTYLDSAVNSDGNQPPSVQTDDSIEEQEAAIPVKRETEKEKGSMADNQKESSKPVESRDLSNSAQTEFGNEAIDEKVAENNTPTALKNGPNNSINAGSLTGNDSIGKNRPGDYGQEPPDKNERKVINREIVLDRKTKILLQPREKISSETLIKGDQLHFRTIEPVILNGIKVIAKDALAVGTVKRVQSHKETKRAILEFSIDFVEAVDRKQIPLFMTFAQNNRKYDITLDTNQIIESTTKSDERITGEVIN